MASTASESTTSSGSASSGRQPAQKRLKSLTTTDLLLVPPGEVLLEEFLRPMGISQYRLAQAIDVPESRINAIVKGRRAITADTDLRLCRFFKQAKQAKQTLESVLPTIQSMELEHTELTLSSRRQVEPGLELGFQRRKRLPQVPQRGLLAVAHFG